MIVTQAEARKIIAAAYGPEFKIRLTGYHTTIGVRPVWQTNINMHTLAWRKLSVDRKGDLPSAVYIGRVMPNGSIDWDYQTPMRMAYLEDIAHKREFYKMDIWTFGN